MARYKDREKAILLRKQGMSYSQIKKKLKVSKSTLSLWLRKYPLPEKRIRELRDWNEQRIERCRETKRKKREKRLKKTYNEQKIIILPLNKREIFLAGLFLYWGEGAKSRIDDLSISNTDPAIIKFFIYWLEKNLSIDKKRIRVYLHLYSDMDIAKEKRFWAKILNIPLSQFNNPYIKKTSSSRINYKGTFGHGTCNLRMGSVPLMEKVLMSIKVIRNRFQ